MIMFEVDFCIKINATFQTIHKEFIFAESVSECQDMAELISEGLTQSKNHQIHIFIGA